MRIAIDSPRPYLLNQAGGICQVREFSLIGDQLKVVPKDDKPLTGLYELVFRCEGHQHSDIRRGVSSDGEKWSLVDDVAAGADDDVCYPSPEDHTSN